MRLCTEHTGLSPVNKGLYGERDFRKFLAKRRDYLLSTVSCTEIDLLRRGTRELPAAVENLAERPWIAWSSQAQERSRHYWGWGWNEGEGLPTILLPLEYPHTHALDLATSYERAYETNRWAHRLQFVEQNRKSGTGLSGG